MFSFESSFDLPVSLSWMREHWKDSFYYAGIYLAVIFGLRLWMTSRPKFQLQGFLATWNVLLAGFSIFAAIRILPEWLDVLMKPNGFYLSICLPMTVHSNIIKFWLLALTFSKVAELGDTIFVVLRKQPLIFLHYYHHVTVLIYCWYTYSIYVSLNRWFAAVNSTIHSIMYSYYALRALQVKIPKRISISITLLQILQMILGIFVGSSALTMKFRGEECDVPFENIFWSLAMYFSYFLLFAKFFYESYLHKRQSGASKKKK